MAFSATSFFAGVGTVFAAVAIGFAGGATITTSSKVEPPNRLERVAAGAQATSVPAAESKPPGPPAPPTSSAPPAAAPAVEARDDAAQASPPADRVIPLNPTSQLAEPPKPIVAPQPSPAVASDDAAPKSDTPAKAREAEPRKEAVAKKAERRAEWRHERRKRQDLESAANAVRQMRRDDGPLEVIQRDDTPRFGFFSDDD